MTIDELIKILENYEMFVDDDFGGSYKSVIAYAPDKKVSRAHTPIGILKIIDTFEEMQQENQELKKQLEVGKEQYNDLVEEKENLQEQLSSNILQFENRQKEFIEWLENLIGQNETVIEVSKYGLPKECSKLLIDFYKSILSKYKEIIGGKDDI